MTEDIRQHIINRLLARFPGDGLVTSLCVDLAAQDLREISATLIVFFAQSPAYDSAIILLQDVLDEARKTNADTHKNAWGVVWQYRNMFEQIPTFVPRQGELFSDAAKRLRWQLGEEIG